jgi:TatD DNase family protein
VIDSHTHLHACRPPDSELVAAARQVGITKIVTVGTDARTRREALHAAEQFPEVYAAIGHHPNEAAGVSEEDLADVAELAKHERCVAIGETGLDYFRDYAPRADQERAFAGQIELAREAGKPLVIHTRAAEDDTIAMLKQHAGGLDVILHCFSMPDRWQECADQGWWFSFAGNVTYPKSLDLAFAAAKVPAERLLVETDAPYLAPAPHRGRRNEPAFVMATAGVVAEARGIALEALASATRANTLGFFSRLPQAPGKPPQAVGKPPQAVGKPPQAAGSPH